MNSKISEIDFKKRACRAEGRAYLLSLCLISMLLALGLAGNALAAGSSVIRDIAMADNTIQIKIDGPIKYSLFKPADPFTVAVELDNVTIGQFKDKIVSTVPGITEIIPTQVETPNLAARLTIMLESPAELRAEVNGNTLLLSLDKTADEGHVKSTIKGSSSGNKGSMAQAITDIAFEKDGDTLELIIKADGKLMEPSVFQLNRTLSLEIPGVSMKATIPSKLPAALKDIKVGTEQGRLKFDIALADKMTTEVYILDDEVVVDVLAKDKKAKKTIAERAGETQEKLASGGKVISLDFQDADIVPILRLLGDVGGYNIVVHPDVKGKITMKLMNVPWDKAMDVILKTFNLEKVVEGNLIRIATVKAFQEEQKSVAENKELSEKAEGTVTKIFTVNYANVDDIVEHDEVTNKDRKLPGIRDLIEKSKILSPRGTISVDSRTRNIIITDIPPIIDEVQRLISVLDKPTQQVLIEARIVEVSSDYVKSLGVNWGLRAQSGPSAQGIFGGSQSNVSVPNTRVISPVPTTGAPFAATQVPQMINLPASTSTITSPTSAVTLGFLNAAETLGLDLQLSAIEDISKAKTIASPKIMTLDNMSAVIKQGEKIPVTTAQSGAAPGSAPVFTTVYIDANLKLTVTPQITPDGSVQLRVHINNDAPDFTHVDNLGNPEIDIKEAFTSVMLNDGETVVIGGIFTSNETSDKNQVPGLGNVPLLGALFKKQTTEKHTTELLIFITPRLVQ
ncbi:MAG: type IV pilus secretin PilQ [Dissulfurispiraceae bacterium]